MNAHEQGASPLHCTWESSLKIPLYGLLFFAALFAFNWLFIGIHIEMLKQCVGLREGVIHKHKGFCS